MGDDEVIIVDLLIALAAGLLIIIVVALAHGGLSAFAVEDSRRRQEAERERLRDEEAEKYLSEPGPDELPPWGSERPL
jgi:hypothetical protein